MTKRAIIPNKAARETKEFEWEAEAWLTGERVSLPIRLQNQSRKGRSS